VRNKSVVTGLLVLTVLGLAACSKPPEQAIQAGSAALEQAKAAGAETYAADALQKAQDALNRADAEKKAQDEKFVLFRSYKTSEQLYNEAKTELDAATQAAVAGKEQAKADATKAVDDAKAAVAAANEALAKAPKSKDTKADLELWANDLGTYATTITEAETAIGSEDFLGAKAKAESVTAKAGEITTSIEAAIEKVNAAKRR
jgi:tRNA U34 5-carboxymethylaminomethyl modifying GTPase MnmE/TrmE